MIYKYINTEHPQTFQTLKLAHAHRKPLAKSFITKHMNATSSKSFTDLFIDL